MSTVTRKTTHPLALPRLLFLLHRVRLAWIEGRAVLVGSVDVRPAFGVFLRFCVHGVFVLRVGARVESTGCGGKRVGCERPYGERRTAREGEGTEAEGESHGE